MLYYFLVSEKLKGIDALLFCDELVTSGGNFAVNGADYNQFTFMQVTLTLPPDLITTLVAHLTEGIRRELAAKLPAPTSPRSNALLTVKMVAGRLKLHEKTVVRYIKEGRINASNHGTLSRPRYRVHEADCEAFYKVNRSR